MITLRRLADHRALLLPLALVVAGATATLFRIGSKSIWYDEAMSVRYSTSSLDGLLSEVVGRDTNGIAYYMVLRGWILVVGEGEGAIRALSAIFAVITLLLVYAIGSRLMGRAGGFAAAALLLASRMFIEYAQEARFYALAMLIAALGTLILLGLVRRPHRGRLVAYAVLMGVGVYAHLFVGFVMAAHLLWLIGRAAGSGDRAALREPLIAGAAFGITVIPIAAYVLTGAGPTWILPLSSDTLTWTFLALSGDSPALIAVAVAAVAGVTVHLVRGGLAPGSRRDALVLVLLWAVVPIVAGIAVSFVRSMLVARYFLVALPALCLVVVYAVSLIRWRPLAVAAYGLIVVVSLVSTVAWYDTPARFDWRGTVQAMVAWPGPGDRLVIYESNAQVPFDYYVRRLDVADAIPARLAPGEVEAIATLPADRRPPRIWLVLDYRWTGVTPPALALLLDELTEAGYEPRGKDRYFGIVKIRMMVLDQQAVAGL